MTKDPSLYIREMLQMIANARQFVGTLTREEFQLDHKTVAAVLLELTMLGEIAKHVPDEVRNQIAIPWRDIAGFRDKAIHDYSKIDREIIAGIVFERLTDVAAKLKEYESRLLS